MDKKTAKKYQRLVEEQERINIKINDFVTPLKKKLTKLKKEEDALMAQEILAICRTQHLDLFMVEDKLTQENSTTNTAVKENLNER